MGGMYKNDGVKKDYKKAGATAFTSTRLNGVSIYDSSF